MGWSVVSEELGEFIEILPPQKRVGEHWYQGTADAVFQNLYSIMREQPRHLIVLSGDHVYKMDYARMLESHEQRRAAVTLAASEVPLSEANRFGIVTVNEAERITGFKEKPQQPAGIPGSPDFALASMGVYISIPTLTRARGGRQRPTAHDFGKTSSGADSTCRCSPIASTTRTRKPQVLAGYQDPDAYFRPTWTSAMSTRSSTVRSRVALRTYQPQAPPAKFVFADAGRRCSGALIR
jgi:glucose-1-phosphate adenylyltransferase